MKLILLLFIPTLLFAALGTSDRELEVDKLIPQSSVVIDGFAGSLVLESDGSGGLSESSVSSTELGYLSGITSLLCGISDSCSLTNKTIDGDLNTISNLAHGSEVDNPSSGVHGVAGSVVGTSDAQVITLKDYDGGTATNTSRVTIPKAAKATLDALNRKEGTLVYATDDAKAYIDDGSDLVELGAGGDGTALESIYAVLNAEDSDDMTDWTLDADITGSIDSATPLKGLKSYSMSIVNTVSVDDTFLSPAVAVPSRANDKDVANTNVIKLVCEYDGADDDIELRFYDATGTAELSTPYLIKNGLHSYEVEDNLLAAMDSVKLQGKMLSTLASTQVLECDSITFDDDYMSVKAIYNSSDWTDYTPVFTGFGTVSSEVGSWRRLGDTMEVEVSFVSGTATGVEAQIDLPSGYTIASGVTALTLSGFGDRDTATIGLNVLSTGGDTFFNVDLPVYAGITARDANLLASNGDIIKIKAAVKIEGWKSDADHVVRSEDRQQAHFVGSIEWQQTASLQWLSTSTSFASYAADPNGADNARTVRGEASETATNPGQYPAIVFPSIKAGTYKVHVTNLYMSSANLPALFRITDGTISSEEQVIYANASESRVPTATFDMHYSSDQDETTFEIQGKVYSSGGAAINGDIGGFKISVYYYPPPEEKTVPTLYALPQGKVNRFSGRIAPIDSITNGNIVGVITGVSRSTKVITVDLDPGFFDGSQTVQLTLADNVNLIQPRNVTVTANQITFEQKDYLGADASADYAWNITITRGNDYSDQSVFVGNVAKTRVMHFYDAKSSTTQGGTCGVTAYTRYTRDVTNLTGDIFGSLSANQITLPAGEYYFWATAPFYRPHVVRLFLHNFTDTADVSGVDGDNAYADSSSAPVTVTPMVDGKFTISSSKTFELQYERNNVTYAGGDCEGVGGTFGTDGEKYAHGYIVKLK